MTVEVPSSAFLPVEMNMPLICDGQIVIDLLYQDVLDPAHIPE